MRIIADEHVPAEFVTTLRGEGHDVVGVSETVGLGTGDEGILEYARREERVILSENTDFRGADATLDLDEHPGILTCDTGAKPGAIATAVRRIDTMSDDLTNTILFVPSAWV